jgi:hypothetical protein
MANFKKNPKPLVRGYKKSLPRLTRRGQGEVSFLPIIKL